MVSKWEFPKETDISGVRDVALMLLYTTPKTMENIETIINHPFFDVPFQPMKKQDGSVGFINITESDENFKIAVEEKQKIIEKMDSPSSILELIRNPYRMTFIKYVVSCVSIEDFSNLLGIAWTTEEFPNDDVNVNYAMAKNMFKIADKKSLMNASEYDVYNSLPDPVVLYRGVSKNEKGLSWTTNPAKAEWFSKRWETDVIPYVLKATVPKKNVLAFFGRRDEDEVIAHIDYKKTEKIYV